MLLLNNLLILLPLALQAFATPVDTPTEAVDTTAARRCSSPTVRKEWRTFSAKEKTAWFDAFKCLNTKPHDPKFILDTPIPGVPLNTSASLFDDLVYLHAHQVLGVHFTGMFLSWHRWLVHTAEQLLRSECGYKGPMGYWDWSKDARKGLDKSSVFDPNSRYGLGSLGQASDDFVVTDGAWADQQVAYPTPHTIVRNYTALPYKPGEGRMQPEFVITKPDTNVNDVITSSVVNSVIKAHKGDYKNWYNKFDAVENFHAAVHFAIGGDIGHPSFSPNDPLFYLHHGNVDRIWALWQAEHPSNQRAFNGAGSAQAFGSFEEFQEFGPAGLPPLHTPKSRIPNLGFGDAVRIADVLDIRGGYLCYSYA